MSVKNLSRAIIQGGRSNSSKWNRRHATRVNRHRNKILLTQQERTIECEVEITGRVLEVSPKGHIKIRTTKVVTEFPAEFVDEPRMHVYPEFADHLGPLNRWLDAYVGRSWEEVHHKLCRYNRRSTAGWHLVDDHALKLVQDFTNHGWSTDFIVDADGMLCHASDFESHWDEPKRPYRPYTFADKWAHNRKVVDHSGTLFWNENNELTVFTEEDILLWETLRGYDQRSLKGYHRGMNNKRRLDRELPWQTRWREKHSDSPL